MKRVLAQALFDVRTWWRNGEQLLLMLVLPGGVLAFGQDLAQKIGVDPTALADGALLMAFFATAFTGQSILTAFDRRSGALLVIGAGPMGRQGFILARIVAVVCGCVIQLLVLTGIAALRHYDAVTMLGHGLISLLAVPAFVGSGLLLAGVMRAERVLVVANLAFVVTIFVGGIFNTAPWTPFGAVKTMQSGGPVVTALAVLTVWTAMAGITAQRTFRWVD